MLTMESNLLESKIKHVNEILKERLPESEEYGRICESMSYSVLNGGKRLRAIMLLESFRLFSDDKDTEKMLAEPFAAVHSRLCRQSRQHKRHDDGQVILLHLSNFG